jgi:hypothetical protein
VPPTLVLPTEEPDDEIGPAPPRAASQTMISNSLVPDAEEGVKRS